MDDATRRKHAGLSKDSLASRPWDYTAHVDAAWDYLANGRTVPARQEFARAEWLGDERDDVCTGIGVALVIEGRDLEAIEILSRVSKETTSRIGVPLAAAHLRQGNVKEAQRRLKDISGQKTQSALGERIVRDYCRALIRAIDGELPKAIALCNGILNTHAEFSPAYLLLAQLHEHTGDNDEALRCYREFHRREPRNVDAVYHLARCLCQHGELEEANRVLKNGHQQGLRASALDEVAGLVLFERRQYPSALRIFSRNLADPARRIVAIENTIRCRYQLGQHDELLQFIESLPEEEQDLPLCNYLRAVVLLNRSDPEAALPFHRRSAEQFPDNVDRRYRYVVTAMMVASKRGVDMEGVPRLTEALARDFPDSGYIDLIYGCRASLDNNWESAVQHFTSAVNKMPDDADTHFMRGEAMYMESGGKGSREMYEELLAAIRLTPNHHGAWLILARYAAGRGDLQRALETVQRAQRCGCNREFFREILNQCQAT